MMDRIERYRVFVQVAELGSFIRAAQALGVPRATVSAAVQQLEHSLGVRLLHRTTRTVQLTADGLQFLEQARALVADADQLEAQFRQRGSQVSGQLVIDAPSRIARRMIAPALPSFLARHPGLQVFLGSSDRFIDLVQDGIDCAVRFGEIASSSLVVRTFGQVELVNCASPDYVRAHGLPQRPDQLPARHCVIGYTMLPSATRAYWDYTTAQGAAGQVEVSVRLTVNNAESYIAGCLAGLGLIQVPRFDVQDLLDQGQLLELMPDHRAPAMPVSLVYPHRRQRSPKLLAFHDWFQSLIRPHLQTPPAPP